MNFEIISILYLFGFLCGFLYAYFYYRPTRTKEADAATKAVEKILKEKNIDIK